MSNTGTFVPKTLREIKNYDLFEFVEDEIGKKDWYSKVPVDYKSKIIFNEGVIAFNFDLNKTKIYAYLNSEKNIIECYLYDRDLYEFNFLFRVVIDYNVNSIHDVKILDKGSIELRGKNIKLLKDDGCKSLLVLIFNLMAYLSYTVENKKTVIKENVKN